MSRNLVGTQRGPELGWCIVLVLISWVTMVLMVGEMSVWGRLGEELMGILYEFMSKIH